MPTIEITITPTGQTTVETKGFQSQSCRQASEFLEAALGQLTEERLTDEFYSVQQEPQRLPEHI